MYTATSGGFHPWYALANEKYEIKNENMTAETQKPYRQAMASLVPRQTLLLPIYSFTASLKVAGPFRTMRFLVHALFRASTGDMRRLWSTLLPPKGSLSLRRVQPRTASHV
jgi:hypothetical protein